MRNWKNLDISKHWRQYALISLQLALIWFLIGALEIEKGLGLILIRSVIVGGFVINALLKLEHRRYFFPFLGVVSILLVAGWEAGGLALSLIALAICIPFLPIKHRLKQLLLVLFAVSLLFIRSHFPNLIIVQTGISLAGAVLMFRMLLFLYEVKHQKEKQGLTDTLSYFLLLPNSVFYLFPIVDYKTFKRSFYKRDATEIYQKGVNWMMLGLFHLLLYRFIYHYCVPAYYEINTINSLIQYLVFSYMLVLRLSGMIHFSAGVICLFGYDLPRTFDFYFLASGFSDVWRRINVYYKDFVMKLVYYPLYFKLKSRGMVQGMILASLLTFLMNWFFHAYQWLWLRGDFLIKTNDIIYWAIFGILVSVNAYFLLKKKKKTKPQKLKMAAKKMASILGMFSFMCVLWSFWISPSISEWFFLMMIFVKTSFYNVLIISLLLMFLFLSGTCLIYYEDKWKGYLSYSNHALFTLSILCLLSYMATPLFPQELRKKYSGVFTEKLNEGDKQKSFNGYYDDVLAADDMQHMLVREATAEGGAHPRWKGARLKKADLRMYHLKANQKIEFKGKVLTTNEWGMRDKSYSLEKPDSCFRMLLLGGSIEMGSGVADGETYEQILENKLNFRYHKKGFSYEILNLAESGYHGPQMMESFDSLGSKFNADILFYPTHEDEKKRLTSRLAFLVQAGNVSHYADLQDVIDECGARPGMPMYKLERLLYAKGEEIQELVYAHIAKAAIAKGVLPVMIQLGVTEKPGPHLEVEFKHNKRVAEKHGFLVIDMYDIYKETQLHKVQVSLQDIHPNAKGHNLIARRLLREIRANQRLKNILEVD